MIRIPERQCAAGSANDTIQAARELALPQKRYLRLAFKEANKGFIDRALQRRAGFLGEFMRH